MLDSKTFSVDSCRVPNAHIFWRSAAFRVYFNLGVGLRSITRCYSESVDILCLVCTSASHWTQHLSLILRAYFFEVLLEINIPRFLETLAYFGAANRSAAKTFVVLRRRKRIAAIPANSKMADMANILRYHPRSGLKTAKKAPFFGAFSFANFLAFLDWTSARFSAISSNPLRTQETRHE